jgi:hypothetical protein
MSTYRNLISVREAARACDVCTKTLQNWQRSGQLVPILVGGGVAYDPRTLKQFLAGGGPHRNKPGVKPGTKWDAKRRKRTALARRAPGEGK